MFRSSTLMYLVMCVAFATMGCSGSITGDGEGGLSGTGKNNRPPDGNPKNAETPGVAVRDRDGVHGILGCPTEPLPAYGNASSATLSKAFQSNCAACHGGAGQGSDKYPALPGKLSRDEYIAKVRMGVREMPAFSAAFVTDDQLASDFDNLKKLPNQPGGLEMAAGAPDSWSDAQVEEIYRNGLQTWRKAGDVDGQACTNCHSADGVELAIIGFKDDAILRRGQQHLAPEDALKVRDFIHAQRRRLGIAEVCSPDWRPFQPGGRVLPGNNAAEQDASFVEELQRHKLMVATGKVVTLEDANKALAEMQAIDMRKLPIGIALPRWSEDKFNGPEHRDINDYMAPVPTAPNRPQEYFAMEDEYLQNPTDAALYKLLDENRKNMNDLGYTQNSTVPAVPGNCPSFSNSTAWIKKRITEPKRLNVIVAAHLFREEIKNPGAFYKRPISPFPDAPQAVSPAFFLGGFAIEPPCYDDNNYPNWIKSFPAGFRAEFPETDLVRGTVTNATDRITHNWMMLGQVLDPSLISTDGMQTNKLHYWAFRNFTQKEAHLPFTYVHRMATQVKFWKEVRGTGLFPAKTGPFDEASREWLHPFLATNNQNSAGLRNAVDPESRSLPGVEVNRLKGNLIRMMMLISQDQLKKGMPLQQDQNDDHCLSVICQTRALRGYVNDLKAQTAKASARAAYEAKGFDLNLYETQTASLIADVLARMEAAPRR